VQCPTGRVPTSAPKVGLRGPPPRRAGCAGRARATRRCKPRAYRPRALVSGDAARRFGPHHASLAEGPKDFAVVAGSHNRTDCQTMRLHFGLDAAIGAARVSAPKRGVPPMDKMARGFLTLASPRCARLRASLAVAVLAVIAGAAVAHAGPCIPDGGLCRTNQSCCGRVCVNSNPPGKRPQGRCTTPLPTCTDALFECTCASGQPCNNFSDSCVPANCEAARSSCISICTNSFGGPGNCASAQCTSCATGQLCQ
jgi:hypothetical protein